MKHDTRYQAVIIQDDKVLLIRGFQKQRGRSFWLLPGGHTEGEETIEECLVREMREETHLEIQVDRLLMEMTLHLDGLIGTNQSYLCTPIGGELKQGCEPEDDDFEIAALRWFDLSEIADWSQDLLDDPITYPELALIRLILGYTSLE